LRRAGRGGHHEPPEVAELLPELPVGADPELKPLEPVELELELDPLELEPDELDPDVPEPEVPEPEVPEPEVPDDVEPELVAEPELEELDRVADEPEDVVAVWVVPGRTRATAPAAATLDKVTAVVAVRTLARPRSLAATARRRVSRCALLMSLILRSGTRSRLDGTSRFAMRRRVIPSGTEASRGT
jgi:hypothetical protein